MEFTSNFSPRDGQGYGDDSFIFATSNGSPHSPPGLMTPGPYTGDMPPGPRQLTPSTLTSFGRWGNPSPQGIRSADSDKSAFPHTLDMPSNPPSPLRGYAGLEMSNTSQGNPCNTMTTGTDARIREPNSRLAGNPFTIDTLARQNPVLYQNHHHPAARTHKLVHRPPSFQCKWQGCRSVRHFSREADLIRHIRTIHISPYAHPCYVEGCDRSFGRKDHLQEHLRRCHHLG